MVNEKVIRLLREYLESYNSLSMEIDYPFDYLRGSIDACIALLNLNGIKVELVWTMKGRIKLVSKCFIKYCNETIILDMKI